MSVFDGSLRMSREPGGEIHIQVDLTDERIRLLAGDVEIADWELSEIVTTAQPDGIHVRAEGEEVVLNLTEDAEFALELGLRSGPPLLMRNVSRLMRERASE